MLPNSDQPREQVLSTSTNRIFPYLACGCLGAIAACGLLGVGIWIGKGSAAKPSLPPELLQANSTHGTSTMAICTAPIDEEVDGFFALDYLTGDLKGWVFNPRNGSFGGLFLTNISQYLGPPGKNAEYLLVSGRISPPASGSSTRAASMVLYVVDVRGGGFAAFSVPWDRTMRNTGATQASLFLPVGGDMIRPPVAQGAGPRKPAAGNAANPNAPNANPNAPNPKAPNAPANNPAGNNAPGNNANPPKNNQNPNQKNP
jgi:hypothetical protein